jgi:hypothetical protein
LGDPASCGPTGPRRSHRGKRHALGRRAMKNRRVLSGVTNRDQRAVLREAQALGLRVSLTRGNHIRVDTPNGPVFSPLTSGTKRAGRNLRSALRRKGVSL